VDLARPLKYSFRRLLKRPGFTLVAVLSLALGIGANTAMFSLLDAVVLRGQPFSDIDSLVEVFETQTGYSHSPFSYPDFEDLRRATGSVFSEVGGSGLTFVQADTETGTEMITGELVTANYFSMLGLSAHIGRAFAEGEDVGESASPLAILGYRHWQKSFGGDTSILGRELRLSGRNYTVIGVAPPEFHGSLRGFEPAVYLPVSMDPALTPGGDGRLDQRGAHWFFVKARRRPEVSDSEIEATLAALVGSLKENDTPTWDDKSAMHTLPSSRVVINPMIDKVLFTGGALLMALVVTVLTIACANLASFLLARATDQRKEMAVRIAMGASRRQLVAQQLLDALLLSVLGGAAGAGLAAFLARLVRELQLPVGLPLRIDTVIDGRVLLFCVGVSLLSAVLFGLAPALQSTRLEAAPTLKDEGTGGGSRKQRLRGFLVAGQVALSTLLLVSAGLFLRSLMAVQSVDPGFGNEPTAVLTFGTPSRLGEPEERRELLRQLREEAARIPGAVSVGFIDNLHLTVGNTQGLRFNVDGVEPPEGLDAHSADYAQADAGFFETAGVPIVEGRGFLEQDREDTPLVAVVSQAFAERFFAGRSAVGQRLRRPERPDLEIVGVSRNVAVRFLGEAPRPLVYVASEQNDQSFGSLLLRTGTGDASAAAAALLRSARGIAPDLMVLESKTLEDHLQAMLFPSRALAALFAIFAGLALGLAAIGLYGIVSFTVAARAREIGIRVSLGATGSEVVGLFMRSGLLLVAAGGAIGLVLGVLVAQAASALLFQEATVDPLVFLGVPLLLLAVTGVATFLPARRAMRMSPSSALRAA
jgi:predicted permease